MAIKRMISRDGSLREWQADMIPLGRIRTGVYATPAGKRGRPEKLDRFRFTSPDEALIRAVADEYGGEARPWSPDKDPNRREFEVITDTDELDVLILNGQKIDPTYEAWAAGRTCVRRCDGVWDMISQAPCVCTGPDKPTDPQKLCKITTRVRVMLRRVAGVGSWMYESHGEYFATETGGLMAELVARASVPVPSVLRLELERRREPDREKGGFKTKEFYVARFRTTAATPQQAITGGDVLTQALTGAPVRAIESTPVSVPAPAVKAAPFDIEGLRPAILADIEACTTVEALDGIRAKLKSRGVDDKQVVDAWLSKKAAVEAAAQVGRPYRVLVTGSRTWTDVVKLSEQLDIAWMTHKGRMVLVHGKCEKGADLQAAAWAKARGVPVEEYPADWDGQGKSAGFIRNGIMVNTRPDIVLSFNRGESKGTEHCTTAAETAGLKVLRFTDDTPVESKPVMQTPGMPLKEYRVGDTVTVGGIEFTKIREMPSIEDMLFEAQQEEALNPDPGEAVMPCLNPYCAGTDTPCGFTPQQHMEVHGVKAIIEADRAAGLIPGEPVDGTVETTGPILPDVPEGDYDADELYTMLMTGASQQKPPLTTSEVNALICRDVGVEHISKASGRDLARLRAGLKAGTVTWR